MPWIDLAAEDGHAIIDMTAGELAPHPFLMGAFGSTAARLGNWRTVWDLRASGRTIYHDIFYAYEEAAPALVKSEPPIVLVEPGYEDEMEMAFRASVHRDHLPTIVPANLKPLPTRRLDLSPFDDEWDGMREIPLVDADIEFDLSLDGLRSDLHQDASTAVELGIVDDQRAAFAMVDGMLRDDEFVESYGRIREDIAQQRQELLGAFLERIATNSLFSHLALVAAPDRIRVVPFHGHSLHQVDTGSELLSVRPSRVGSAAHWAQFASAISELEELLNTPGVSEGAIERHLRAHPLFLRGLNYSAAYHQVVLPLSESQSLRPDVIVEPVGQDWAEIVDLKLPDEPIFVGGGHRVRMSSAIAEAAAQLREYAAYFDDRSLAKTVEDKYGFRCYKPQLVVIIGRDPRQLDEQQRRAALSAYPDLRIVTYDQLLRSAQDRILF